MLSSGRVFRQVESTRLRERQPTRFDSEDDALFEDWTLDGATCLDCDAGLAADDAVLADGGHRCHDCDAHRGLTASIANEVAELELGLLGSGAAMALISFAVAGLTWNVAQGAWHWAVVAWIAAQILGLWIGLYGTRQGYDAVRALDRLADDDHTGGPREGRVDALGRLVFWGGVAVAGGCAVSLFLTVMGGIALTALTAL